MAEVEAKSEVTGAVWKITTQVGQKVEAADTIMIIESMKMEIPVMCEESGVIAKFVLEEKTPVREGEVGGLLTT